MRYLIFLLLITSFSFSQSEIQLKKQLQKELKDMKSQGASPLDIHKKFLQQDLIKYVWTMEEFYRTMLFFEDLADIMLDVKIKNGTLNEEDEKIHKRIKNK